MVMDPQHPEHEKDLETFYLNFAQPNSLTIKQCLVLAVQVVKEGAYGLGGWQGALLAGRHGHRHGHMAAAGEAWLTPPQ